MFTNRMPVCKNLKPDKSALVFEKLRVRVS